MRKQARLFLPVLAAVALVQVNYAAEAARCDDIDRGYLSILSINILYSEIDDRNKRLRNIARFVANQKIDVVLLQEVSKGRLVDSSNTSRTLRSSDVDFKSTDIRVLTNDPLFFFKTVKRSSVCSPNRASFLKAL